MNSSIFICLFVLAVSFVYAGADDKYKRTNKPAQNDNYKYIAANNILMWISNTGDGSHHPITDEHGLIWPGGITGSKGAVYEDGLVYGAKINNEIRVNGSTYRQGLQAGKIISGQADDPSLEKYRVYKIKKGWENLPPGAERDALQKDYNEWPIEDGAPYIDINGDGIPTPGIDKPKYAGDETLWYVSNDMDTSRSRRTFGMDPAGLEFQTTLFSFNNTTNLYDIVFKKYKIINKGSNTLNDMIISYWADPDLGDARDDYCGFDTVCNMAYGWNGDNDDRVYGSPPPAAGYVYLQGPLAKGSPGDSARFGEGYKYGYYNLPVTAFVMNLDYLVYRNPQQGVPAGSIEMYNYMQGKCWDGSEIKDPHTGLTITKMLTGDPVTGTGWFEGTGWPGGISPEDRRILMSSGSFTMNPGDTQEVVFAIVMGRGSDYVNSITAIRKQAANAIELYNHNFLMNPPIPPAPAINSVPMDSRITIWWEKSNEEYSEIDPMLNDTLYYYSELKDITIPVPDKNFTFEGYRIWQFDDKYGNNPRVISTIDKRNKISTIRHYLSDYLGSFFYLKPYAEGEDKGIYRYKIINKNGDELLNNGTPYYFAVTAYAYSKYSDPPVIESIPEIIEVIPGRHPIDAEYTYDAQSYIYFSHTSGRGDGEVKAKVIDPDILTGNEYEVSFKGSLKESQYFLVNKNTRDTLISGSRDYTIDSLGKEITEGFMLTIDNRAYLSTYPWYKPVKNIQEIKGPGGSEITPVNVFSTAESENKNSTGEWTILCVNTRQEIIYNLQYLVYEKNIGTDDYEIRFTSAGSEYYTTGYRQVTPIQADDPKGKGKVPFEVWKIPSDTSRQPVRLVIKTYDFEKDTSWSQDSVTGFWESIYTFTPYGGYPDTLPPTSTAALGANNEGNYKICNLAIKGNLPAPGTVIRLSIWKPLSSLDKFTAVITAPKLNDPALAKKNINEISVFPNPYYSAKSLIEDYPGYIRFTNLPQKITIRIFSLSGVFIKKIEKDDEGQYADWDLKNKDGLSAASGMYIAYLEIPGVAAKVIKIALVK